MAFGKRLVISALVSGCAVSTSSMVWAEYEDDSHITSDIGAIELDVDRRAFEEVQQLLNNGYPPHSVFLHGISKGVSIDDMVFLAARAQPDRAEQFSQTAIDMLPALPAWACREASDEADNRYAANYRPDSLPRVNSLESLAQRFFDSNERLSPFPDWLGDQYHTQASVSELRELLGSSHWYQNKRQDRPVNAAVMVSMYEHNQTIIVDDVLGQVEAAAQAGQASLPVVVLFNESYQRPISEFGEDITVQGVASAYFDEGKELTHVPNWNDPYGDYHHVSSIDDIEQIFPLPEREDIEESRWDKINVELVSAGFDRKPVLMSLYENDQKIWVDEPDRLTAARELGIEQVPVVYLYHSIDRLACGELPGDDCEERIKRAAQAAIAQGG